MKTLICLLTMLAVSSVSLPLLTVHAQTQTSATQQSAPLLNKDIIELTRAGLSADVIVAKIKSSPTHFDTSPTALSELKAAGVADTIILAMVNPNPSEASAIPASGELNVPDGTEIMIELKTNASGEQLKVGDIVDFVVSQPVTMGSITVFEKGAVGRARITTAKRAGHWGKAGKLEWAMQDVQAVDGNRVPTRFVKREVGDSKGGTVAVAAVATTVLLGPVGLFWGLKKGKPAIIPAGNRYSVFVNGDTKVKLRPAETATITTP
jgi:hypothetical protein